MIFLKTKLVSIMTHIPKTIGIDGEVWLCSNGNRKLYPSSFGIVFRLDEKNKYFIFLLPEELKFQNTNERIKK